MYEYAARLIRATAADHDILIEDGPDGPLIRYREYVLDDSGSKLVDPFDPEEVRTEERTVPLVVEPPEDWPVYTRPHRERP
jgi:hypothetical protein